MAYKIDHNMDRAAVVAMVRVHAAAFRRGGVRRVAVEAGLIGVLLDGQGVREAARAVGVPASSLSRCVRSFYSRVQARSPSLLAAVEGSTQRTQRGAQSGERDAERRGDGVALA